MAWVCMSSSDTGSDILPVITLSVYLTTPAMLNMVHNFTGRVKIEHIVFRKLRV